MAMVTRTPLNAGADGLCLDGIDLTALAREHGTPLYVYSAVVVEANYRAWNDAFGTRPHRVHYAVKANHNPDLLRLLAQLGSGFDIVSVGELELVLAAGGDAAGVVFSGVGKRRDELERALEAGIGSFNVESRSELALLDEIARAHGVEAPVALRVNPDVDPKTHPYIATGMSRNKFGIAMDEALPLYREAAERAGIRPVSVACHIGSQLTEIEPMVDAAGRVAALVQALADEGIALSHVDLGGGLGIDYAGETPPTPETFVAKVASQLPASLALGVEPGRSIAGPCGVLLTQVLVVKRHEAKTFVIVDAAMNDLMRPSLYGAEHRLAPVVARGQEPVTCDVVGPVCETGDFLARDLTLAAEEGDLLAVSEAGAYGYVMASNYNVRGRPAELWIENGAVRVSRRRETLADQRRLDRE